MNFDQRYAERTRRSAELFADASKIVAGSRITDVDGNSYVDYLLGLGPTARATTRPPGTRRTGRSRARPSSNLGTG